MAVEALNIPKIALPPPPPPSAAKPKAQDVQANAKGPVPVQPKPAVAPARVVSRQPEIRRAAIADQVIITARKDQGKFGHVQPAHTPAPKPAASGKPGRHSINIVG